MHIIRDWDEWIPGFFIVVGLFCVGLLVYFMVTTTIEKDKTRAAIVEVADQKTGDRFVVEQGGKFSFDNDLVSFRRIILIHDKLTGKEYMGVQGFGTVEITKKNDGKTIITEEIK